MKALNDWYHEAAALLDAELKTAEANSDDNSLPSQEALDRARRFLWSVQALNIEIPATVISNDGDIYFRWGRGRAALSASFCYDGFTHFTYKNETIERMQMLVILSEQPSLCS